MIKMLDKKETAKLIETFEEVKNAHSEKDAESWKKYYKSKYKYAVADNGNAKAYIKFEKPSISSDIWYDDEKPDPFKVGDKKQVFINHNLSLNFKDHGSNKWQAEKKHNKEFFEKQNPDIPYPDCSEYNPFIAIWNNDNTGTPVFFYDHTPGSNQYDGCTKKYMLSNDEVAQLMDIYEDQKAAYLKRLETYYKRYESKIYSHGYWANR